MHSISSPLPVAADRRYRLAGFALVSIWLLQLIACTADEAPDLVRFIEENPQQELDVDLIYELEPIYDWALPGATPSLGPDRNLPLLDREVDMAASEAQVVEVLVESMPQGTLALRWRNDDYPYSKERQIQLQAEHQNPGPIKRFRFKVNAHPLWEGSITGLRLYTDRRIRDSVAPIHCRVLQRIIDQDKLKQAVDRGWKVNLSRDIRNALLAMPNSEIVRRLTIPAAATFHFGYGLDPGIRTAIEFQVLARQVDGTESLLFSDALDGALDPASEWREAAIDLAAFEGQTVDLALRALGRLEPENGFPFWANPAVVSGHVKNQHPNVVVVSIDTLRADHLSLYGYDRETSPNLDRWASENAVVFEKAVAQAPSTLPSHTSMFTGLDAFRHGANHDPAPISLETLAEALRRSGYRTLAQTGGGYMHPAYGFDQGFDVYRYWLWGYKRLDEFGSGLTTVRGWLDSHGDRPFFLFFHTYEVHAPYRARQPFFERLTGRSAAPDELLWMTARPATAEEGFRPTRGLDYRYGSPDPAASSSRRGSADEAIDLYDSSIAYVDSGLARIFELLERPPLADNTLVVITSDHGESFGEHDLAGHGYLYDDNLLVPLIVAFPGRQFAGRRVAKQVRSIDILPTLLDALGLPQVDGIDGQSLVPLLQGAGDSAPRLAWSYAANDNFGTALRLDNQVKYIFNDGAWPPIEGQEELYE
ncbi:MAG: sulfatase, partial [Acidobacteriota bacterium]